MSRIEELLQYGREELVNANYAKALSYFEQALLLDQHNPDILNLKGAALRSMGRYEEAVECFNKSLEVDPRDKHSS